MRGELLRSLRREQGWTQEEAAHRAQVSEKLFRKAEQGGRVDGRSLAALASIFSAGARGAFCSQDLLLSEEATSNPRGPLTAKAFPSNRGESEAGRLLENWLRALWEQRAFEAIDRWGAPAILFHCEVGILHGREAVRRRYEQLCVGVDSKSLTIEALKQTGESAACRWRTVSSAEGVDNQLLRPQTSVGGATAIHLSGGMILEASEFLDSRHGYQQLEAGEKGHPSNNRVD